MYKHQAHAKPLVFMLGGHFENPIIFNTDLKSEKKLH
jgi:hypothetical protein